MSWCPYTSTSTASSTINARYFSREAVGCSTSASGTTCTLSGGLWRAVASGGTTTASSTGIWDRSSVRMARGPMRRAGSRFGGFGEYHRFHGDYYNDGRESRINREQRRKLEQMKKGAHETSMRLLRSWLSKLEYEYLMEQGQLELPSQYEKDVIYIVKKDTHQKVKIAHKQKLACIYKPIITETAEACINISHEYPTGDMLLSNIALLKTDEKQFLKIANISQYARLPANYNPNITIGDFAGLLIREVRNTHFWFVQFDIDNRERPDSVNHCHETDRALQFPAQALIVESEIYCHYNDIRLPTVGQYFINAPNMNEAIEIARHWRRLDCINLQERQSQIEAHAEQAEQYVEQEYAGGFTVYMNGSESPLMTYATDRERPHNEH